MALPKALAASADYWCRQHNVELVLCWVPTIEDVSDGIHRVMAVGNDMMAAELRVNTEMSLAVAGDLVLLSQLSMLGRLLTMGRYQETAAGMPSLRRGDI